VLQGRLIAGDTTAEPRSPGRQNRRKPHDASQRSIIGGRHSV
jgi:hypothetical protein